MEWTVAIGVDSHEVETTETGYRSLLSWALELGLPAFAVEGCGSYGAGLVRFLELTGVPVWECEQPRRRERRRGKSDLIDAALAARRLLTGEGLCLPRGGGRREELRLLLLERRSAIQARTAALNQLSALVVTAPEQLRQHLGRLSGERLARAAARLRPGDDVGTAVVHRLGHRAERLSHEVTEVDRRLLEILTEVTPALLAECGVGPVCAAQLLVSSGDPNRMASEASFAALAGTSPLDASSGQQRRRRRPPAQPGAARDRARPHPPPRRNDRLLPTPTRRRQDRPRGTPLRQTRTRPLLLPPPPRDPTTRLDNIEASKAVAVGCDQLPR